MTSFLSGLRCPEAGNPGWYGILVFTSDFLNSGHVNLSHSHTEIATGLVHSRAAQDTSFVRFYIAMSQTEGSALGFTDFQFVGGHAYGALVNDSSAAGSVYVDNANTTLSYYYFIRNSGPVTYLPGGSGRIDFIGCIFSGERVRESAFGKALRCTWNATASTVIPMTMLKTAFCEGNWNPRETGHWWSWAFEEWIELALTMSAFMGTGIIVWVYVMEKRKLRLPRRR
jgi:hypothetical protein